MPSALVIGSGPNGLAAAIHLARHGYQVQVHEANEKIGGAATSGALTLPGFVHDLGSAVHPTAVCSPFFRTLPLQEYGLEWIFPPAALAHPLQGGRAVIVERDLDLTADSLGADSAAYRRLYRGFVSNWTNLIDDILRPQPGVPHHPLLLAEFGFRALQPAWFLARSAFKTEASQALFAGMAAHSFLPLEQPLSSAFGLILGGSAHAVGWPIPRGGSQSITNAMAGYLRSLGGSIHTSSPIESIEQTPPTDVLLCDITPRQFLRIAGSQLPSGYADALRKYRYGPGVFKVDWALREPIPWTAKECLRAGTVHIGGTLSEIAASERACWSRMPSELPFVLLAQQSLFDSTRAPAGQHTAWAYCHVPNGWDGSHLQAIEGQIERFAPGFQDVILARATRNPAQMESWNSNLVGGDINGGAADWQQFILRPTWRQYATPLRGVYLCSSSTPPGGGVHGMCGFNAAAQAIRVHRHQASSRRFSISR